MTWHDIQLFLVCSVPLPLPHFIWLSSGDVTLIKIFSSLALVRGSMQIFVMFLLMLLNDESEWWKRQNTTIIVYFIKLDNCSYYFFGSVIHLIRKCANHFKKKLSRANGGKKISKLFMMMQKKQMFRIWNMYLCVKMIYIRKNFSGSLQLT